MRYQSRIWTLSALAVAAASLGGCSSDSGSGGSGGSFLVQEINVPNNSVWFINRAISIRFSRPVDFSTINLNSVNIREIGGAPAVGEFSLADPQTVIFQPLCPRLDDLSDSGLRPGGVAYELKVLSAEGGTALPVRAADGSGLSTSEVRSFTTPTGTASSDIFFDTQVGPPRPVVRDVGSADTNATYIELGGDPDDRVYFERNAAGQVTLGEELSLNLLSNPTTEVALMVAFDQPVEPFESNINAARMPWQFLNQQGFWEELDTLVTLEQNCSGSGAVVRLEPLGVLPPGTQLRAVVTTEFADLVGDTNSLVQQSFAPTDTRMPPTVLADSLEEEFLIGGDDPRSNQDFEAAFGEPAAEWGEGALRAAFSFDGTGGIGGNFDWEIKDGEFFVLNTVNSTIVGGEDFLPTSQQVVIDGVVDVRNMRIGEGAVLKIEGPNPCQILASGSIEILGRLDISGTSNVGVVTLNTTNIPEPGSPGQAGGGRGGTGSPLSNASSPCGGRGQGAFGVAEGGGEGGETGWNEALDNREVRRGGGGGGGRFGPDQYEDEGAGLFDQTFIGLDAEQGFANLTSNAPPPKGAKSGVTPPIGGLVGPSPFVDSFDNNDFFGAAFVEANPGEGSLVIGELNQPHAGSGGGGGGDAAFTNGQPFPVTPFDPSGDEKGGGAGGGGGSLRILALGDVVFGPEGTIVARGGSGGGGENTNFVDRVAGGAGGGSGGHVIIETASQIDMSQAAGGADGQAILVTGGQGAAGKDDLGGSQLSQGGSIDTSPENDACPTEPTQNVCRGHIDGAGGDGSPGIIQLHTPTGLAGGDILVPPGMEIGEVCQPAPVYASATERLIPSFGRTSIARSIWIPLGQGGFDPDAQSAPFYKSGVFEFGDVDQSGDPMMEGFVQTTDEVVNRQDDELLGPEALVNAPLLPSIGADGRTLMMDASSLTSGPNRKYFNNPGLLDHFIVELSQLNDDSNFQRYDVVDAVYSNENGTTVLTLTTAADGPLLTAFTAPGGVKAALIPSFFRVETQGIVDRLPDSASVRIRFRATTANAAGLPDETMATDLTADPDVLNNDPNNSDFRFLQFQVDFDIDTNDAGLKPTNPIPSVRFLRIPFDY